MDFETDNFTGVIKGLGSWIAAGGMEESGKSSESGESGESGEFGESGKTGETGWIRPAGGGGDSEGR